MIETWNVRTLCPGLCDIESIDGVRRSAVLDEQLSRLRVSIAALQETRLSHCGAIAEAAYTILVADRRVLE